MTTAAKLAAFAAMLALLFACGALAGNLVGPERTTTAAAPHDETSSQSQGHTDMASTSTESHDAPHPVRGLAVAEDGLRVVVDDPELRRGATERLSFAIVDSRGDPVRDFEVAHEKRMHLILARRDLTGFQHLHPRMDAEGRWSADVKLDDAGSYRLFADFARGGEPHTLAADLRVDGAADLRPLPDPAPLARTDTGYEVRLDAGAARAGQEADLRFTITRNGEKVSVQPYLGANGHLVALRDGDLAFLHVHPHGDDVAFAATFPTPGRYRLFLQFKHEGRVHTAAFTQEVQ